MLSARSFHDDVMFLICPLCKDNTKHGRIDIVDRVFSESGNYTRAIAFSIGKKTSKERYKNRVYGVK
jgi:hypothetical protein